jgi:hypothetical protein
MSESHKLREKHCDGRVLVAIVGDPSKAEDNQDFRQKCRACGMKTNHFCTGCKNYLCFGAAQGFSEKRVDAVMKRAVVPLTARPKPTIKMTSFDPKTDMWTLSFAKNCCYLLQHRDAFNTLWERKHTTNQEQDEDADSDVAIGIDDR